MLALTTKVEQSWDVILSLISSNAETENRGKRLSRIKVVIEYLLLEWWVMAAALPSGK